MMIRQGDVLIQYVDAMPQGLVPVARTERGLVLAEGEVTGHCHVLLDETSEMFREAADGTLYLRIPEATALLHTVPGNAPSKDHDALQLKPGIARVVRQYEATARDEARMVAD